MGGGTGTGGFAGMRRCGDTRQFWECTLNLGHGGAHVDHSLVDSLVYASWSRDDMQVSANGYRYRVVDLDEATSSPTT